MDDLPLHQPSIKQTYIPSARTGDPNMPKFCSIQAPWKFPGPWELALVHGGLLFLDYAQREHHINDIQITTRPKIDPLFQRGACENEDFANDVADILAWDVLVGVVVMVLAMEFIVEAGEVTSCTAGTVTVVITTPLAV
jgi:hypothetical protein